MNKSKSNPNLMMNKKEEWDNFRSKLNEAIQRQKSKPIRLDDKRVYKNYSDAPREYYGRRYLTSNEMYDVFLVDEKLWLSFRKDPERNEVYLGHNLWPHGSLSAYIVEVDDPDFAQIGIEYLLIVGGGILIYQLREPFQDFQFHEEGQWQLLEHDPESKWNIQSLGLEYDDPYDELPFFYFIQKYKARSVMRKLHIESGKIADVADVVFRMKD